MFLSYFSLQNIVPPCLDITNEWKPKKKVSVKIIRFFYNQMFVTFLLRFSRALDKSVKRLLNKVLSINVCVFRGDQ
jgi:hypothetical protein